MSRFNKPVLIGTTLQQGFASLTSPSQSAELPGAALKNPAFKGSPSQEPSHAALLRRLAVEARQRSQLEFLLTRYLDIDAAADCRAVQLAQGLLTVQLASNTHSARLHYLRHNLIKQLKVHPEFQHLKDIRFRVRADSTRTLAQRSRNTRQRRPLRAALSPATRQLLSDTAGLIGDPELSAALKRLATAGLVNG